MKALFIALALLMLVGCAQSGPPYTHALNGNTSAYCAPGAVNKKQPWYVININTHLDICLARMEEAMRAREEMDATQYEYLLLSMSREQARKTWDDKYDKTQKLWNDAKRDCWSKP